MLLFITIIAFFAIAAAFAMYLVMRDRGEREPVSALWAAFGFGVLAVVAASIAEAGLPDPIHTKLPWGTLLWVALAVGLIEELCKALPLMLFLYRKRYFNEHTDGVIYFALAGLGFGLPENILYTLSFGTRAGLSRVILTPLFHAATTAIIGYALARYKIGKKPFYTVVLTTVLVILLHAFYDFGLLSGNGWLALLSIAITVAASFNVFILFIKAKRLDEELGLSVVGNNSYCRSCGKPNPQHYLYCSQCGKRA